MAYCAIVLSSGELYHHGILGQKWGQRNGPPYPLGASDHSAREKAAGYTKSIKKARSEYTKSRNERYKQYRNTRSELFTERKANAKALKDNRSKYENDHSAKEKYKSDLKKVASDVKNDVKEKAKSIDKDKVLKAAKIGATVAVAGLAAYGGYKLYKSGQLAKGRSKERDLIRIKRNNRWMLDNFPGETTAITRGAIAGNRVGNQVRDYNSEAWRQVHAAYDVHTAIRNGEQSTLAIFDNLTSGHNSMSTLANLIESGSSNQLASNGFEFLKKK